MIELEKLLEETLREDWMEDNEFQEYMVIVKKLFDPIEMEKAIQEGIKNGYSREFQIKLIKKYFKRS